MNERLVEAAERDLLASWRALGSGRAGLVAGVKEREGLLLVCTGARVAYFNGAFVLDGGGAGEAVMAARSFFAARKRPFTVRARADREDVAAAALRMGAREALRLRLMALQIPASLPQPTAAVSVVPAVDVDGLARHAALMAVCFSTPVEAMTDLLGDVPLRDERFTAFNGLVDGEAVATSALFLDGGVAGLYDVATLPSHRGRGIGAAMSWHAVRAGAARGADVAVLQASPMGEPVYERMGFRVVAQWRQFRMR